MKFIVSSAALLKELQMLGGVINSTNTLPILDNFLFEINGNSLTLTASDLETTFSTRIAVESESNSMVALPARLLLDTLKTFPEQPLTFIKTEKNTVEISANNGKYAVAYVEGNEFPKAAQVNDAKTTLIQSDILYTAINSTLFASGNDDLRPVMSGVFFQFSTESLTFVATDAHKLVKYTRSDVTATDTSEFIMPKKPLQLLKGILQGSISEISIEYNDTNAQFRFGDSALTCRLIDGKYPNYEAVIPKENPNQMQVSRVSFLNSVRRVSIFSNKTTHQIRLKIAGAALQISAEDFDYSNSAEERLDCDYQGDDIQIGFNSRFLIEMLNNMECDQIKLSMSLPNRAGILTPLDNTEEGEHITMLVMPVMLNE
ncbi:MAG: DNA polymerase III subunit beta [Flavobacteriaceae bacterium]|jgi:DNA polymerase-3 subunit beta|nr:DNA polymerase III subunit beta [Flavobacteriaceae bacterium]MBT4314224.1 DNA polymerase III subunit beta [Flavobacteriaceae bacterium]MBT5091659.1 DNA polymerase III subunit beta [Flavobacteriaceae bacterium]MBT5283801.1 DNA polymerase III subunit beta [Flavobacteriaceae bacterium]MBT5447350.1 DNA polymerase III subunit beta [Flavobacteriaceae bacterium]|tara:strand:+ start:22263 stop:23381 length:1119 start_codon:yes stop_codon:yes gene_type:complete